jgi:hypothetical protein
MNAGCNNGGVVTELGRNSKEAAGLSHSGDGDHQSLADDMVGASSEFSVLAAKLFVQRSSAVACSCGYAVDDELGTSGPSTSELVSVVGNLVDNAIDAAGGHRPGSACTSLPDHAAGVVRRSMATGYRRRPSRPHLRLWFSHQFSG